MSDGQEKKTGPQTAESVKIPESMPDETQKTYKRTPVTPKAHFFVTLSHWAMVTFLTLALLSGMRIGWGFVESPLGGEEGIWAAILASIAPTGTMFGITLIHLHVTLAFFMVAVAVLYVVYMVRSRASRRMRMTAKDMQKLQAGLKANGFWSNKPALWSANLLVYWIAFVFVAVLLVTGTTMYYLNWHLGRLGADEVDRRLFDGAAGASFRRLSPDPLHHHPRSLAVVFWPLLVDLQSANLSSAHACRRRGYALRPGLVWLVIRLERSAWETLTVWRAPENVSVPVLDGVADDPIWQYAGSQKVRTVKGVNNPEPYVDITVKSVHDGKNIYFMFQWKDPDASYKRFPLRKTVDGWEVLQTAFDTWDENAYYEDKLSVYVTDVANGSCAKSCHLGVGPHADKGDKHGLHYTTGGETADVWHWKSVRTNNMAGDNEPGWSTTSILALRPRCRPNSNPTNVTPAATTPIPKLAAAMNITSKKSLANNSRGRSTDPSTKATFAGAQYLGGTEFNKALVQPIMLPRTLNIKADATPSTSEEKSTWWIHKAEGVPYEESLDTYPVGTLIPNILLTPFKGDRSDVRAKGKWKDGYWTLEIKRVLDTGSKFDVPFKLEKPVYISVAAYNRTQTRHSEHIRPIQLVLRNSAPKTAGTN